MNSSFDFDKVLNETWSNETFDDSVDTSVDIVNASACGIVTYSRSYASWHEGDKRRRFVSRVTSVNLRAPLSYR